MERAGRRQTNGRHPFADSPATGIEYRYDPPQVTRGGDRPHSGIAGRLKRARPRSKFFPLYPRTQWVRVSFCVTPYLLLRGHRRWLAMQTVGGRNLKVGGLPDAVSHPLVDAGIAVGAMQRRIVRRTLHLRQRGHDSDPADQLDLEVGGLEFGDDKLVVA